MGNELDIKIKFKDGVDSDASKKPSLPAAETITVRISPDQMSDETIQTALHTLHDLSHLFINDPEA